MTTRLKTDEQASRSLIARIAFFSVCAGFILVGVSLFLSAWSVRDTGLTAEIDLDQCRRVTLVDAQTGWRVSGAEDIAIDRAGGRIFISAYDRRHTEAHARRRDTSTLPQGGIYAVSLQTLKAAMDGQKPTVQVSSLIRASDLSGGLHPHGLDYNPQTDEISFINRRYQRQNKKWVQTAVIEKVGASGAVVMGQRHGLPSSANNIVTHAGGAFVSFDHGARGFGAALEDIFSLKHSGLLDVTRATTLYDRAGFANGVSVINDHQFALAATRDRSLYIVDEHGGNSRSIKLPGGPDNLSLGKDGSILAALHPSLLRMGAHRKLGVGRAPSRVVRVDPDTKDISLVLDDRSGRLFQAATIAVEDPAILVLGSVTDQGLLACKKTSGHHD